MAINWDEHAGGWDDKPGVALYAEKALESLLTTGDIDGLRILDFGAGTGQLSSKLAPKASHIVALDTSLPMLAVADSRGLDNLQTLHGELTAELVATHPLMQNRFDLVVASSVCGFVPDYEGTVRLIRSLLRPGGRFVQWDWVGMFEDGLTPERVERTLVEAGFANVSLELPFTMELSDEVSQVMMGVGRLGPR